MATLSVSKEDEKRVKGLGFLNNKGTDNFSARVITENGLITVEEAKVIFEAAEKFGNGKLAMTTRQTIECQGIPFEKIESFREYIKKVNLETGGTGPKVRPVVSCKGTTCQYGLIDTFGLSKEIHNRFYKGYHEVELPHKFKIAVGGCPNNCVKPDLNDLGIIGQLIPIYKKELCKSCKECFVVKECPVNAASFENDTLTIDEEKCINCGRCIGKCPFDAVKTDQSGYKIYIGGRWGKRVSIGKTINKLFVTQEEALDFIEKVILFYKENGLKGERFAVTIERIGFEKVEASLLSNKK